MNRIGNEFNIEEHKKKYINYLKVIVFPDGSVRYARPSHAALLERYLSERDGVSIAEVQERCPVEYYNDYNTWLCKESGCASVWDNFVNWFSLTDEQIKTLEELRDSGLLTLPEGFQFDEEHRPRSDAWVYDMLFRILEQ